MRTEIIIAVLVLVHHSIEKVFRKDEIQPPAFITEPPSQVTFLNSSGEGISCIVTRSPSTIVTWTKTDGSSVVDIPGVRYVRSDGALFFPPFHPGDYRPEVHNTIYRCVASNIIGSVGSRNVRVRAVVPELYQVGVFDSFVTTGNTAVIRCHVPTGTSHYVTVSAWLSDDRYAIIPTADPNFGGKKYLAFPTGELHIHNVQDSDEKRRYKCQVKNILTGEKTESLSWAKLVITKPSSTFPPIIQEETSVVEIYEREIAKLPCVAHGYPTPEYNWYHHDGHTLSPVILGSRITQLYGTLILRDASISDSGNYVCVTKNSQGQQRTERTLTVRAPLKVEVKAGSSRERFVKYGERVLLNCNVSGYPVETIFWVKDQRPLPVNYRVRQVPDHNLEISSFEKEDSGIYQCYAQNNRDSAQHFIALKLEEKAPTLTKIFHEQLLMPGKPVSLKCVTTGSPLPQVSWTIDGAPLPSDRRIQTGDFVHMDGSLVSYVNITDLRIQDGGSYQCQAMNDVGISNHEARIDVIGRPYIRPMKNLTVVTGQNLEVRCPISGYPIEKVYFKKAGQAIPSSYGNMVQRDQSLIIHDVRTEDAAVYACVAENGQGESAIGSFVLNVVAAPVLSPISFPKNLEEGMRTSVTCTVLAGDPPISLAWFKDGQPIQHNDGNTRVVTISEYIISLVVDSVHRRHSGNYTCIASNMAASVNTTASMIVRASPRWRLKPIGTSTVLGQMVRLECQASGQPNPVIRWKYSKEKNSPDYENVISGPHKHVLENGSLSITGVMTSDYGYYLCEADNGVGSPLTETVQLQVHVPPRIEGGSELIEVKKSKEVSLSCSSYGDDPLALTWTKNGEAVYEYPESRYKILDLQDLGSIKLSTLRITSVERKDSTVFTCVASNPYGTDSKTFDVIVKEIPDPPNGIKVNRVTSTTVSLKWSEPYSGNSPITSYTVAYRTAKEEWGDTKRELTAPASQNSATISGLEPRTTYYFTVTAENVIGISSPGKEVKFTTGIEAPRSVPSDVTAVTVDTSTVQLSWTFPQSGQSSDVINGFYVGYKEYGQKGPYNLNRTVYANSTDRKWKILIRNLRRSTRYSFVVQAFNDQGPGSMSQEVVARTFEFDPPHTPILRIAASTSTSLRLVWQLKTEENTPARGFVLNYKEGSNAWKDIEISPDLNSYILDNLRCGAAYQVFLTAFNDVGRSDPSDVIKVTLKGNEPKAPEMRGFIITNSSAATLNLQAWKDGGCRLQYFVIQYKPQSQREWILLSNHVVPDQKRVAISDLHPGTWYDLLVTALNDAGTTEAEYRFATLTLTGATIPPIAAADIHQSSFIKDPAILVPIVCAIFVLLVIVIVTSLVIVWRRRDGSGERGSDAVSRNSGGREDNISMSSYGKTKSNTAVDNQREPLYYPSPYATTHIAAETGDRINHATIRRARNRPSDYTYDVPHRQQCEDSAHQYSILWINSRHGDDSEQVYEKQLRAVLPPKVLEEVDEAKYKDTIQSGIHVILDNRPILKDFKDLSEPEELSETEYDRDHSQGLKGINEFVHRPTLPATY